MRWSLKTTIAWHISAGRRRAAGVHAHAGVPCHGHIERHGSLGLSALSCLPST